MTRFDFREAVVNTLGEPFAYSYLDRSLFVEGRAPRLHPWSTVAAERWRMVGRDVLKAHGVTLANTMPPDAWREPRMAAE